MPPSGATTYRPLFFFILVWIALNLLQAAFTPIDGDEAYYWLFARNLDWGYFDHPPAVALSIKLGEWFGHGPLFTRGGTVLFSAFTVYFGFKALPDHLQQARWYLLSFASVVLFHVYGFIATPDASLLFFTSLFFYAYKLYLEKENLTHAVFIGLSIAGLVYSKYHGALPVFFTLLSNPRLSRKRSAWLAVLVAFIAVIPHLVWQHQQDWPTVRYHLLERIGSGYRIDKTTNYILSQALVWGPFSAIPAIYFFSRMRPAGLYQRAHHFTFFGILIFFFLNTFRSTIEPHWTLAGGISFCVLMLSLMKGATEKRKKIFSRLMVANIVLLLAIRIVFVVQPPFLGRVPAFRTQFYGRELADSVYAYAGERPVVFPDSYVLPAIYLYYHPSGEAVGYPTVGSRKNYFSVAEDEAELNGKSIFVALQRKLAGTDLEIDNRHTELWLHSMPRFRAVNFLKLSIEPGTLTRAAANDILTLRVVLSNPSRITVDGRGVEIGYAFLKTKKEQSISQTGLMIADTLGPGYSKEFVMKVRMPPAAGKYRLVLTTIQSPFGGSFSSPFYPVEVD